MSSRIQTGGNYASAILSDVLAELTSDKQREQLSMRFGEDVILLSENYNKLPVFMSRKADYTDLQSENQIQVCSTLPCLQLPSTSSFMKNILTSFLMISFRRCSC